MFSESFMICVLRISLFHINICSMDSIKYILLKYKRQCITEIIHKLTFINFRKLRHHKSQTRTTILLLYFVWVRLGLVYLFSLGSCHNTSSIFNHSYSYKSLILSNCKVRFCYIEQEENLCNLP